jgi:hypothetical protein
MEDMDPDRTDKNSVTKQHPEPVNPTVQAEGIPGFHHKREEEDGVPLAHMELDADAKGRVDTGTGDQPANTEGSRFATPSGPEE